MVSDDDHRAVVIGLRIRVVLWMGMATGQSNQEYNNILDKIVGDVV